MGKIAYFQFIVMYIVIATKCSYVIHPFVTVCVLLILLFWNNETPLFGDTVYLFVVFNISSLSSLTSLKSLGAVISGRHFRNPVSLSKIIMEESPHCALSGDGALEFAVEKNFPICDPKDLISEFAVKITQTDYKKYVDHHYKGNPVKDRQNPETKDTVSAVAMDAMGHIACATSTGTCKASF